MPETQVRNNPANHRYEVTVDGHVVAFVTYYLDGAKAVFIHTQVSHSDEGHGLGTLLIRTALDDVRRRDLTVVPRCPFVAEFIRRHQDYQDLVDPSWRDRSDDLDYL